MDRRKLIGSEEVGLTIQVFRAVLQEIHFQKDLTENVFLFTEPHQ